MGRKITIRLNYRADTAYLMRLQQAIEIDNRIPEHVQKDMIKKIGDVSSELMRYHTPLNKASNG